MSNMTRVDYFVAHAPPVPDWFRHTPPGMPTLRPVPTFDEPEPPHGTDERFGWVARANVWFERNATEIAMIRAENAEVRDVWTTADETARMVQWAFHYGRAMASGVTT